MDCTEAKSHLSAFASGLTNDLDRSEIEAHLATCEACSLEVELLRGRASGKPAAPAHSDWTIEKIFGDGGGAESGPRASDEAEANDPPPSIAPSAPPSPQPPVSLDALPDTERRDPESPANSAEPPLFAPPVRPPSMILPPPAPEPEAASASEKRRGGKRKSESWDFEPADANREAAPPEESVVLAEKALGGSRESASSAKAAAKRALIWGVGGVAGVGLLGVAAWLALTMQQAPPRAISIGTARSQPDPARPSPGEPDSDPGSTPAKSSAPPDSAAGTAEAPHPLQARSFEPPISGLQDPSRKPVVSLPAVSAPSSAPVLATPKSAAPADAAAGTKKAPRGSSTPAATPGAASSAPRATSPVPVASARPTTPMAAPSKRVNHDDDDMWPTDEPARTVATGTTKSPANAPARSSTTESPSAATTGNAAPKLAAGESAPSTGATGVTRVTGDAPANDAAPPAAVASKPIDRLHAATVKATTDQDLVSLRQLKTAWKSVVRTVVGPDRSRAKRELADCLWAVQALSGKDADQEETLNAYRDYLLSAPAGGADARSAERLRELEDALRERR